MDLNASMMFVGAVRAGSLSAAAVQLNLPLPTISRRIRQLEKALNVQLLERSTRGIKLTDAGMRFYEYAARGVELFADGEIAVRSDQARLIGRLRLSLPPGFVPWWDLLHHFKLQFPDIKVSVYSSERRLDLIHDGIDVALRVGDLADDSIVAQHLLTYRHVLLASPLLLQQLGEPQSLDDLHRFPCAVWAANSSAQGVWQFTEKAFEPNAVFSSNDYLHLREGALLGDFITELPPFLAHQAIQAGRLQVVLPSATLPEQGINLIYPSHRHPSSIVRAYLDYCKVHARAYLQP